MGNLKASDVMLNPVIACLPTVSAREVGLYLLGNQYHGVPVVEKDGKVIGIVTENDLNRAFAEGLNLAEVAVSQLMTEIVMTADWSDDLDSVLMQLQTTHVKQLPVTRNNKLVGIITEKDVLRANLKPGFIMFGRPSIQ